MKVKENLYSLYEKYKQNGKELNKEEIKKVTKLLLELTFDENESISDMTIQLSKFSSDVIKNYFETIIKDRRLTIDLLDDIIKDFFQENKNIDESLCIKFINIISAIIKNSCKQNNKNVLIPPHLSMLVISIAGFSPESTDTKKKFQKLINNTDGIIFMFDYTGIKKQSLSNMWNITNNIYPDITKAKYESFIIEWAKKYGFMKDDADEASDTNEQAVKMEKTIDSKETIAQTLETDNNSNPIQIVDTVMSSTKDTTPTDKKTISKKKTTTSDAVAKNRASNEILVKKLYTDLKSDMEKGQEKIITAFVDMITPIGKAFETIQGEIDKNHKLSVENVYLKAKIEELEQQNLELQSANQPLMTIKTENNELKKNISTLESKISELDIKLNDAYTINSRESSLEAEKIRSELKKNFAFFYEDWLEYEFSDVSEDNYKSLQAIIKKIFRSLERNGIDFKGNNQ